MGFDLSEWRSAAVIRRLGRSAVLLLLILFGGTGLAACSGNVDRDVSVRALIDTETGAIVLPLDAYDLYQARVGSETWRVQKQGYEVSAAACMRDVGFVYRGPQALDELFHQSQEDRVFGPWNVEKARVYGPSRLPDPVQKIQDEDAAVGGQPWSDAFAKCQGNAAPEVLAVMPTPESEGDEGAQLVQEIKVNALEAAHSDPDWKQAKGEWDACVKERGLTPRRGDAIQTEQLLHSEGEALIGVAVDEAECSQRVNLTQRLADVVAGYQQALIAENQAALNDVKRDIGSRLDTVEKYVQAHG